MHMYLEVCVYTETLLCCMQIMILILTRVICLPIHLYSKYKILGHACSWMYDTGVDCVCCAIVEHTSVVCLGIYYKHPSTQVNTLPLVLKGGRRSAVMCTINLSDSLRWHFILAFAFVIADRLYASLCSSWAKDTFIFMQISFPTSLVTNLSSCQQQMRSPDALCLPLTLATIAPLTLFLFLFFS